VIIETPTIKDLAGLIVESKAMFEEMGFEKHGNSWEQDVMQEWWEKVLTTDSHDIVVAKECIRIVGVSVVYYPPKGLWHRVNTQALELAHHAAPDLPTFTRCKIMIKMLQAIMDKVAKRGPLHFKMSYLAEPGFDAWGNYLMKKGFTESGRQLSAMVKRG
jgi:hypothetical protein